MFVFNKSEIFFIRLTTFSFPCFDLVSSCFSHCLQFISLFIPDIIYDKWDIKNGLDIAGDFHRQACQHILTCLISSLIDHDQSISLHDENGNYSEHFRIVFTSFPIIHIHVPLWLSIYHTNIGFCCGIVVYRGVFLPIW